MIIVLSGADFSAKNIGKAQFTRELSDYTKAAITASGNTNLTGEQKAALDSLFITMGVDGSNTIMSKIKKIYLPIIAADLSKVLVDYSTSSFNVDATPSATNWAMRNHGIVSTDTPGATTSSVNFGLVANNFFGLILRTEMYATAGTNEGATYGTVFRGGTTSKFIGMGVLDSTAGTSYGFGSYGSNWGSSLFSKPETEIHCDCINNSAESYDYYSQGVWKNGASKTPTSDTSTDTRGTLYHFGIGNQNKKPVGVSMLGNALTLAEAKSVVAAVEALYNTFK